MQHPFFPGGEDILSSYFILSYYVRGVPFRWVGSVARWGLVGCCGAMILAGVFGVGWGDAVKLGGAWGMWQLLPGFGFWKGDWALDCVFTRI